MPHVNKPPTTNLKLQTQNATFDLASLPLRSVIQHLWAPCCCVLKCWSVMLGWRTPHWMLRHLPSMHVWKNRSCMRPPVHTVFHSKNKNRITFSWTIKTCLECVVVMRLSPHYSISWVCRVGSEWNLNDTCTRRFLRKNSCRHENS